MKLLDKLIKIFSENKKLYATRIIASVPVVAMVVIASISFYSAPLTYDEAYNLQVSVNLAEHGEYATNGSVYDGQPKQFDTYISTGPTLLIPIAFMFKLFGVDVWQFRFVMNIIFISFCVLTVWMLLKATRDSQFSNTDKYLRGLLAVSLASAYLFGSFTSKGGSFFSMALGEPLGLCLIILSVILLQYKKPNSAALVLGLAILTKFIFILFIPFFIIELYSKHKDKFRISSLWKTLTTFFVVCIPVVVFEIYKFIAMGLDISLYKANLKEFASFFNSSGGDPSTPYTPLQIVIDRLSNINNFDQSSSGIISFFVFGLAMLAVSWFFIYIYKNSRLIINRESFNKFNVPFIYILGSIGLWFFWWTFISSTSLERYIAAPLAIVLIAVITLAYIKIPISKKAFNFILIILISVLSFFAVYNNKTTPSLSIQREESRRIVNLYGQRDIYNFGWWQNPEILFLSSRTSTPYDFYNTKPGEYWVLTSKLQQALNKKGYDDSMTLCDSVIDLGYYRICQINI